MFCGSRDNLTKEHVYPRWLYRAMGVGGTVQIVRNTDGKDEVIRSARAFDVTVREVCRECNNGWLNDLEQAFRTAMLPALQGHTRPPTSLGIGSQEVVATWAIKTWLLAERAAHQIRGGSVESPGTLLHLRREHAPPKTTQVWLGAVRVSDNTFTWLSSLSVRDTAGRSRGTVGAFTVGAVVFVIYGPMRPPDGVRGRYVKIGGDALVQVWPHEIDEARWPPPTILTPADLPRLWPSGGSIVVDI